MKRVNVNVKGLLYYHSLIEPRENLSGLLEYSGTVVISKSDTAQVEKIKKAIDDSADIFFGAKKPSKWASPLKDGDELIKRELEKPEEDRNKSKLVVYVNSYVIVPATKAKVKGQPPERKSLFVDSSGTVKYTEEDAKKHFYMGATVVLSTTLAGYSEGANNGVGCYLNNAQFVKHGERIGYSAGDEFSDVSAEGLVETENF